jgi:hypothetical protein
MTRLILVALVCGAGFFVTTAAGGERQSLPVGTAPLGPGDGRVWIAPRRRDVLAVRFSRRAARTVRGRRFRLSCPRLSALGRFRMEGSSTQSRAFRLRRGQRVVHARGSDVAADYCSLYVKGQALVDVPLTQEGARALDERATAQPIIGILGTLTDHYVDRLPTTSEIIEDVGDSGTAALSSPDGTPPPGSVGVWGDGRAHLVVAAVSASGRRLFVELAGDRWSSNFAERFQGVVLY